MRVTRVIVQRKEASTNAVVEDAEHFLFKPGKEEERVMQDHF